MNRDQIVTHFTTGNMPAYHCDQIEESARLETLRNTGLLDSVADAAFDRLTLLLTQSLQVPTALISLVDEDRQFFKSTVGLGEPWASARETPLSHSFCQYTVATAEPLIITDARLDPGLKDNLAIPDLSVIAYAGAPLKTPDGYVLGALCAIDSKPRDWTDHEISILINIAEIVSSQIETYRRNARQVLALKQASELERKFKTFMDHSPAVAFIKDEDGRILYVNKTMLRYYPNAENWVGKLNEEIWPPDVALRLRANDLAAVEMESGTENEEYVESTETSAQYWLTFKFPLHDGNGRTLLAGMSINIDKRKREEAALRASELKVRAIYDSALQFIGLLDTDGTVIDANATALSFIDQPLSAVAGRLFWDCPWWTHSTESVEQCRRAVQRAATGEIVRMQTVHIAPNGRRIEVDFSLKPMQDHDGRITHLIPEGRDITSLRNAERELLASAEANARRDEFFRLLVEGVKDYAIFMLDPSGCIQTWNEGAARLKGYAASEIIGRHFSTFYSREDVANGKPDHELKVALKEGKYVEDGWRIRKDGSAFYANVTISAITDAEGKLCGFAKITKDLTERRNAEIALRDAEIQLRCSEEREQFATKMHFLADTVPGIVWTAMPDGNLTYYNRKWFDYTGMTFEQTKDWGWKPVLHPDDLENCLAHWSASIATGNSYEVEYRFRRGTDGEYRWHLGRAVPRRDEAGSIVEWVGTCTDIHDQKMIANDLEVARFELEARIEERTCELVKEKRSIEAILNNVADGIVACDADGVITLSNRSLREVQDIVEKSTLSDEYVKAFGLFRQDGTTLMELNEVPLYRALQGEVVKDVEMVIRSRSGTTRRVVASGRPLIDDLGRKFGAVVGLHDITERVAVEQKFRLLFEHSSHPLLFVQSGKVLDANQATLDLLGCKDKSKLLSIHPSDLSPDFQPDGQRSKDKRLAVEAGLKEKGYHRFDWILRKFDGTEFPVEVSLTAIQLEGVDTELVVWSDLTERLRTEAEIASQKLFMEAVLENISDGIIACDADYRITYMNPEARRTFGIHDQPDEMTAEWGAEHLGLFDPASQRRLSINERPLGRALKGEIIDGVEVLVKPQNAGYRRLRISARPIENSDGNIVGAVVAAHDVTELHQSQQELLAAKETAEAASRAKGDFLANMSHEIRTPMTSIIGYADLLSTTERSQEERQEFVHTIRRNGEHLLNLINDLLDLSKIDAGKMTVEHISVSPEKILAEVESPMRVFAAEKNVDFVIERRGLIPESVQTDPTRIRQVLLNLVSNAIKFTTAGFVRITLSFDANSRMLTYSVQDSGIGLTDEQQGSLFQPFMQADASTTRRFGGTGLGLALSKRLVEMLGGTLTVQSKAGQGSTFSFSIHDYPNHLANVDRPSAAAVELGSHELVQRVNARVLLAEDAADNRRLVTIFLEQAGMSVDHAVNGRVAVDKALAAASVGMPYDAILMDMQMPELDGYGATRELRAKGLTKVPVIAFTAHAMESERRRCTDAGCDGFVTKPVNPIELIGTIARHVSATRSENQVLRNQSTPQLAGQSGDPMPTQIAALVVPLPVTSSSSVIKSTMTQYPEIADVIAEYVGGLSTTAANLKDLFDAQDLRSLQRLAHQMRGAGGGYGFNPISDFAGQLEDSVRDERSLELIGQQVSDLLGILQRVEGYAELVR